MYWFAEWMLDYYRSDLVSSHIDLTVSTLYATAFKFVTIGAALLQSSSMTYCYTV
jgi:hypothetical protein